MKSDHELKWHSAFIVDDVLEAEMDNNYLDGRFISLSLSLPDQNKDTNKVTS